MSFELYQELAMMGGPMPDRLTCVDVDLIDIGLDEVFEEIGDSAFGDDGVDFNADLLSKLADACDGNGMDLTAGRLRDLEKIFKERRSDQVFAADTADADADTGSADDALTQAIFAYEHLGGPHLSAVALQDLGKALRGIGLDSASKFILVLAQSRARDEHPTPDESEASEQTASDGSVSADG
jgi:hypothetical protein